jgi:alpha-1,3-fucosyltransferase
MEKTDREFHRLVFGISRQRFFNHSSLSDDKMLEIFDGKSKTAAWFVSNCKTQLSRRNELTKALLDLQIDVDIYRACGKLKTPEEKDVFNFLEKSYKFYFSFENSLCEDYVTEKLFKVMNNFIIPVVFAGADLSRFVPPKSYIDDNEFKTVEDLAVHLKFLATNPDEYVKYFWWKNDYEVKLNAVVKFPTSHWCRVCQKVQKLKADKVKKVYKNIENWSKKGICRKAKVKF